MTHEMILALAWQVPAAFTAVPMVARMLPFKLPERAIPLMYFLVTWLCMVLPGSACLALGVAGLMSMLHVRLGEKVANVPPPDMAEVANKLALGWDYIVTHLPQLPVKGNRVSIVHDGPEDATSEDDGPEDENPGFQEPPPDSRPSVVSRIPPL